jgi:hypothetical protein
MQENPEQPIAARKGSQIADRRATPQGDRHYAYLKKLALTHIKRPSHRKKKELGGTNEWAEGTFENMDSRPVEVPATVLQSISHGIHAFSIKRDKIASMPSSLQRGFDFS